MSELAERFSGYHASGEINSVVDDAPAVMDAVAAAFEGRGRHDRTDGLTIRGDGWFVSVRSSNTEPLLRLNVEARDEAQMAALRDEALAIIGGGSL
jgi:phosphomannomutase